MAVARDSGGYLYIGGGTNSPDFPVTAGAYNTQFQGTAGQNPVPFLAKLSPSGQILWATYLGMTAGWVSSIRVDAAGNVYAAGHGASPLTPGAPASFGGGFVMKLDPSGSTLLYGARMGDNGTDGPMDMSIALDGAGNTFVAGAGSDSCCANPEGWAMYGSPGWDSYGYIQKLGPDGSAQPWSLIVAGNIERMTRDANGFLYVTGYGAPPCTVNAVCTPKDGSAFVIKVDPSRPANQSVLWCAVLGGAGTPAGSGGYYLEGDAIAVDAAGHVYVGAWTGLTRLWTSSHSFEPRSFQTPSVSTVFDSYIFSLNATGTAMRAATYLSGGSQQVLRDLIVDAQGYIYAAGETMSHDFLTTAYSGRFSGPFGYTGAWYAKFSPNLAAVSVVRFGGHTDYLETYGMALDGAGGIWGVGYYNQGPNAPGSSDFPATIGAQQPSMNGTGDGIIFHTTFPPLCGMGAVGVALCSPVQLANGRVDFRAQANGPHPFNSILLDIDGLTVDSFRARQLDHTYPIAAGTHSVRVTAVDSTGFTYANSGSFTVSATTSCPLDPIDPTLTICFPLNAQQISPTFTLQVMSNTFSAPASLTVYVDGSYRMTIQPTTTRVSGQPCSYGGTMTLTAGTHRITVQGYAGYQNFVKTTAIVKVM